MAWLKQVLVGAAIAVGVVLVAKVQGDPAELWVLGVLGAVLALAAWVMLLASAMARGQSLNARVSVRAYALAGVLGILLGPVLMGVISDNRGFWPVGFILAGAVASVAFPSKAGADEGA